ncbi:MAG TPA: 1-acyl-sn-glycerol-3-phosphate acyltransferase [Actinobacteria bacterium]|nr:1-acyl-sn-glycerol-3-phosphate acyltransferase [Actinomycetota bacterium]
MVDLPPSRHRFVRGVNRPFRSLARALLDLEITGVEHVPRRGPVILAANHLSHLDPVLVTSAADRAVRYLAVDELFGRSRLFDAATGFFGTIPLDRDGIPIQALRAALEHVDAGGALGVFPEGRRVRHWGETPPRRGAAWLAWMTGAPLVPVAIRGSEGLLSVERRGLGRASIRVWVESPLDWFDFRDHVDPVGAMTEAWRAMVDRRLAG